MLPLNSQEREREREGERREGERLKCHNQILITAIAFVHWERQGSEKCNSNNKLVYVNMYVFLMLIFRHLIVLLLI